MTELESVQSSYIILSADRINEMTTVLYTKEYQIIPIKGLAEILNAIKPLEKINKPLLNNRNKNIFIN